MTTKRRHNGVGGGGIGGVKTLIYIYIIILIYVYVKTDIAQHQSFLLTTGWQILVQRPHDINDDEWKTWKKFIIINAKWFLFHIIACESCRLTKPIYIPYVHAAIGAIFLLLNFNIYILKILLIIAVGILIVANFKRKLFVWAYAFIWLVVINSLRGDFAYIFCTFLHLDPRSSSELIIILSWNLLRLLSFSLDNIDAENDKFKYERFRLSYMLGYVWYFPNLYLGPFMLYTRYETMIHNNKVANYRDWSLFLNRLKHFIISIIRCMFWYFFIELSWHFFYVNCIQLNINVSFKVCNIFFYFNKSRCV